MKTCPHSSLMLQYAQDAQTTSAPWLLWEARETNEHPWSDMKRHPTWVPDWEYRKKPKQVKVQLMNGKCVRWNEPLKETPAHGQSVYCPDPIDGEVIHYTWNELLSCNETRAALHNGMLHGDIESARKHLEALVAINIQYKWYRVFETA